MALNNKQLELKLCPIGLELLQEEHPVEASRAGRNMVYHHCDPLDYRASYAGCLFTMDAVFDGRGHLRPECQAAIDNGTCNAVAMRKMELQEDKALFFVDYVELQRRRGIEWAKAAEESPVQFRRRDRNQKRWTPTEVPVTNDAPIAKVEAPTEIQTNIMEQVLKKKVADANNE